MDWSFTEEQEQIAALARDILTKEVTEERRREIDQTDDRYDHALYTKLRDAGLTNAWTHGWIEMCRVLVEVGRAVAPVPLAYMAVGAMAVDRFGDRTDEIVAPALVEEVDGTVQPATTAERSERGWMITGQKTTVAAGLYADAFIVSASTSDGPTVFLVDREAPGVSIEPQLVTNTDKEAVLSLRDASTAQELGGPEVIDWITKHLTVAICAHQLGVCERALELTAEYSKERVQFDRPIATFQAVGQRLADAYVDVHGIRLTLLQAAWRLAEGLDCDAEIATAKFWASDAGHRVAHTAVHVHGGTGIDLDYHLHRYFTAAKRNEFALGGATEQLVKLGRTLADEPA